MNFSSEGLADALSPNISLGGTPSIHNFSDSVSKLNELGSFLYALSFIVCVVLLFWAITVFSMKGDDPNGRKMATQQLLTVFIAIALLGSLASLTGFFYNFL